jgi:hypothetical protein
MMSEQQIAEFLRDLSDVCRKHKIGLTKAIAFEMEAEDLLDPDYTMNDEGKIIR